MSERIRALTLWQPWAFLLVHGFKAHETRSWASPESLIGQRIAIHAARRPIRGDCTDEIRPLYSLLLSVYRTDWRKKLPLGSVLGSALLVSVTPTETAIPVGSTDRRTGDWRPGRFAWKLDERDVFAEPIAARGLQGLWWWTP